MMIKLLFGGACTIVACICLIAGAVSVSLGLEQRAILFFVISCLTILMDIAINGAGRAN